MSGLSEVALPVVLAGGLLVVALTVAASWTNPVLDVADDLTTAMPPDEVETRIAEALAVVPGVHVHDVLPGTRTVSYRHHPRYSVVLGILTLPVGLLVLLLVRETLLLTVSVSRHREGTRVLVVGRAHKKFATALGEALRPLVASRTGSA